MLLLLLVGFSEHVWDLRVSRRSKRVNAGGKKEQLKQELELSSGKQGAEGANLRRHLLLTEQRHLPSPEHTRASLTLHPRSGWLHPALKAHGVSDVTGCRARG